jgi:hypothetical protein
MHTGKNNAKSYQHHQAREVGHPSRSLLHSMRRNDGSHAYNSSRRRRHYSHACSSIHRCHRSRPKAFWNLQVCVISCKVSVRVSEFDLPQFDLSA